MPHAVAKSDMPFAARRAQGTGSLRLGAAFVAKFMPGRVRAAALARRGRVLTARRGAHAAQIAYISEPTWGNHKNIFGDERVEWRTYRYFDPKTVGLDFDGAAAAAPRAEVKP